MTYKLIKASPTLLRVYQAAYAPPAVEDAACPSLDYEKYEIESISVEGGTFITYSTPDSAFAVTKRLIEAAESKILIGIYDFTARHMRDLLIAAVERGVEVTLMLDCNFSQLPDEEPVFEALRAAGVTCVAAPSCQGGTNPYFRVAHEKVIVIDDTWTLVQSGNYSNNSIPRNEGDGVPAPGFRTGNRDMGVAVKSAELAAFFTRVISDDIQLELGQADEGVAEPTPPARLPPLFERDVEAAPPRLFPSATYTPEGAVSVLPVLTPDNYMDVVPAFLASATRSIRIEQQYIRNFNLSGNGSIKRLVQSITQAVAQNPGLEVRIIVAPPYSNSAADREKLRRELAALSGVGLVEGTHVRLLNKQHFKHCHNKLIIVDEERVLISSQNWSEPAVTINREAGVLIDDADIAGYYARIFDDDWDEAVRELEEALEEVLEGFLELDEPTDENIRRAVESGEVTQVDWSDYAEV